MSTPLAPRVRHRQKIAERQPPPEQFSVDGMRGLVAEPPVGARRLERHVEEHARPLAVRLARVEQSPIVQRAGARGHDSYFRLECVERGRSVVLEVVLRVGREVAAGEEERRAQLEIYILQRHEGRIQAGFSIPEPVWTDAVIS